VEDVVSTFHSTLDPASFTLNPDLTAAERGELAVEVQFYGLLRLMMPTEVPYYSQEQIGVALLQGACVTGTKMALETAVVQARALVFEMGSTTPWLTAEFQDARYIVTDRVINGASVWAAEEMEGARYPFMYRAGDGRMWIGNEANCAAGVAFGAIYNTVESPDVQTPTQLLWNKWECCNVSTMGPQFTSAPQNDSADGVRRRNPFWVDAPDMRVAAVHGLDDAEPAMAAALRQLAALPSAE